jgi:hypothetical protein
MASRKFAAARREHGEGHPTTTQPFGHLPHGRGRNEVIVVGRPPMWCMPDQTILRRGIKEIVHTLPEGTSLYSTALCAMWNIHSLHPGVGCTVVTWLE